MPGFFDFSRPNPMRSLTLLGIGAGVGLAVAGAGLFTARGTRTKQVPPEDIALVNQRSIPRADFAAQLRTLYEVDLAEATRGQRQKVLADLIREELFVERGLELDVASYDPAVRAALVGAVEEQVLTDALTQPPSETELRSYYGRHQERYSNEGTMTLVDLVAETLSQASRAVSTLQRTRDVAATATRLGLRDTASVRGEEYYFAAKLHLGETLFSRALRLESGETSEPIRRPDGYHILVMVRHHKPVPIPMADAYQEVLNDWRHERNAALLAQEQKFLEARAEVLVAPDPP